uniref:Uncharacterized protein n=1 Tax=Lates calcarifer TaxID=8187 RepID=A0A4W6BNG8_LATCA
MPVSMTRADGVTVFTLTSDPKSHCPPVCEIFKVLCYNPVCCTVSQHLRRTSQSVLGTLHIVIGLLNIGFGVIIGLSRGNPTKALSYMRHFVIINVILNLAGVGFAIAAIILYSINIGNRWLWWMCDFDDYYWRIPTPSPEILKVTLFFVSHQMLMRSINAVLVVLSVLELCVTISSAVLGIKALRSREKEENKVMHAKS